MRRAGGRILQRIGTVARPARRTRRMALALTTVGLALGGAAGRLSQKLSLPVGRNTNAVDLRLPLPPIVTPRTLGVDDFSFRKRETYGTVLIDLEQNRPIAIRRS